MNRICNDILNDVSSDFAMDNQSSWALTKKALMIMESIGINGRVCSDGYRDFIKAAGVRIDIFSNGQSVDISGYNTHGNKLNRILEAFSRSDEFGRVFITNTKNGTITSMQVHENPYVLSESYEFSDGRGNINEVMERVDRKLKFDFDTIRVYDSNINYDKSSDTLVDTLTGCLSNRNDIRFLMTVEPVSGRITIKINTNDGDEEDARMAFNVIKNEIREKMYGGWKVRGDFGKRHGIFGRMFGL